MKKLFHLFVRTKRKGLGEPLGQVVGRIVGNQDSKLDDFSLDQSCRKLRLVTVYFDFNVSFRVKALTCADEGNQLDFKIIGAIVSARVPRKEVRTEIRLFEGGGWDCWSCYFRVLKKLKIE